MQKMNKRREAIPHVLLMCTKKHRSSYCYKQNTRLNGHGVSSELAKFVDDGRLFKLAKTQSDCEELRMGISALGAWAPKRKMKFSAGKCCKVMYIGAKSSF